MLLRILGICEMLWYLLRYRAAIHYDGFPRFEHRARITIMGGKVRIGKGFSSKPHSYMAIMKSGQLMIGNNVSLNRNSIIICHDRITIEDNCAIGPNVAIYDHDHQFSQNGIEVGYRTAPVVIGKNCWIGAGVIILRGSHIGEGCVIGAGCVVKGEIPAHSLVTANRELKIVPIEDRSELLR